MAEAEKQVEEDRRRERYAREAREARDAVRWRHAVTLPEGVDAYTSLGLFCEKEGYVIPIGPACLHMLPADRESKRVFYVLERNGYLYGPGPIEIHAKTCTCTLKVKPFDLRKSTCKQP